ncbi:BTAD domain-containing putative transcriptional regulator [Nocardia sp. GCM10030253]|uniref:BTAD domain-containing putative transcriptional regulator n=1 Tax=Nocardia sp. GCM10030253 TaxID=3273404 RepID=UPI00364057BB
MFADRGGTSDSTGSALAALRCIRRQLIDDIGIEPRISLRALEHRILRQDPDLLLPGAVRAAGQYEDRSPRPRRWRPNCSACRSAPTAATCPPRWSGSATCSGIRS